MSDFKQDGNKLIKYSGDDPEVVIPDGVEQLGKHLFSRANNLKKITIPKSVKSIEATMFPCADWRIPSSLEEIIVDKENPYYKSEDGVVYSKDMAKLVVFPAGSKVTRFEVPDVVKEICNYAFKDSKNLAEIILPSGCEKVGEYAFYSCENLENINLNNVKEIEERAFQGCHNLKSVELDCITTAKQWSFEGCWKLHNIKFGKIETIEEAAFNNCAIKAPAFPSSLRIIEEHAVSGEGAVELPESVESVGQCALKNYRQITIYDNLRGRVSEICMPYGNATSCSYDVFVKSKEDGSLKCVTPMHSDGTGNMYSLLLNSWKEDNTFDFESVDQYFKSIKEPYIKTKMSMTRLAYPFNLSDEAKKNYESYLKRNAISIVKQFIDGHNNDATFTNAAIDFSPHIKHRAFELANKWGLLKKTNIDELIEYAQNKECTEWIAFLLDWKAGNAGSIKGTLQLKPESFMVGDVIAFGHYDYGAGDVPMEWVIVDSTKKEYLLVSKYWVKAMPFYAGSLKRNELIGWAKSDVREWLNNEYFDTSFDESEKRRICIKRNKNVNSDATEDRIFIPSPKEYDNNFWKFEKKGLLGRVHSSSNYYVGYEMSRKTWMRYGKCTLDVEGLNGTLDDLHGVRAMMWISKE